jgi:hypothetical protein
MKRGRFSKSRQKRYTSSGDRLTVMVLFTYTPSAAFFRLRASALSPSTTPTVSTVAVAASVRGGMSLDPNAWISRATSTRSPATRADAQLAD